MLILLAVAAAVSAQGLEASGALTPLSPAVAIDRASHRGAAAVRLADRDSAGEKPRIARLPVEDFRDGTIEAEVAGLPQAGAGEGARGFIGIAFRIQPDPARYEAFYIRPTNGRADDQLRRNHSTQYVGMPEFPWHRLRREHPGVYESYADMAAGEWVKLRIEVSGARAQLYVGEAAQPALIVKDLKLGADAAGGVGLWIGNGTEGYFRNVRVTKRP